MLNDSRPNILIIHADQHRWDCLGTYGNPDIRTPHIDALAEDGVRYENSFCPFPVCTPSRYSFLSSQYVHQHLGWTNHCTLAPGIPTFPRVLRNAGYRTKAVGKMHFAPTYLDVGFEEMLLAEQDGPGRFDDDYHRWLRDEGLVDAIDIVDQRSEYREKAPRIYWDTLGALRSDLDEAHHSTTWIAERAIETLDR
ncbi:MAG: sulfatase-like hydrolase/transferase, partial [Anaerolineae bacterium]